LTYSSGNHAQAVALAGRELGVATTIVMPSDAPAVKLEATRGYQGPGDEVVTYDRSSVTREELGGRLSSERGLTIVPPYDDPAVIAGQGTAGLELCEELTAGGAGPLDALFVCCGGGGLLSGCAIAAKAMMPGCRVVGVEPAAGDDATRSFRSRTLHTVRDPETIADGARTPSLGRWTFPLVLRHVDEMRTVSDEQLIAAMRLSMQRMKLVVEPSGVLGLAGLIDAVERGELGAGVERVGVLVSGGNVDLGRLAAWVG
jgi:threonine dehydratase